MTVDSKTFEVLNLDFTLEDYLEDERNGAQNGYRAVLLQAVRDGRLLRDGSVADLDGTVVYSRS